MMRLTLEMEGKKVVIEVPEELDAYDTIDVFRVLMLAMTFSYETVLEVMPDQ